MRDTPKFHQALAKPISHGVWFQALVQIYALEAEVLVKSLSSLVTLTELYLRETSDSFVDWHIVQLASSLPKLEVGSTSGYGLTDFIWDKVASLRSLRRLELVALTKFTGKGILDFIERLGPGNKGLVLSVRNVDMDSNLSWGEQDVIRERILEKVGGRFGFTLGRGHHWYAFYKSSVTLTPLDPDDSDSD